MAGADPDDVRDGGSRGLVMRMLTMLSRHHCLMSGSQVTAMENILTWIALLRVTGEDNWAKDSF